MPIYDFNGTTNQEIGKLFDYNGTTANQIAKVYDNNNSSNSLVYQNAFYLVKDTVDKGYLYSDYQVIQGNGGAKWDAATCYFEAYSGYGGTHKALRYKYTDETRGKYSTVHIQITGRYISCNNNSSDPWSSTCLYFNDGVKEKRYQPSTGVSRNVAIEIISPIDSTVEKFTLWAITYGSGEIYSTINNFWLE